jgi:hypothetical protein
VSSDCAVAGWPTSRKRDCKNNFNFPITEAISVPIQQLAAGSSEPCLV